MLWLTDGCTPGAFQGLLLRHGIDHIPTRDNPPSLPTHSTPLWGGYGSHAARTICPFGCSPGTDPRPPRPRPPRPRVFRESFGLPACTNVTRTNTLHELGHLAPTSAPRTAYYSHSSCLLFLRCASASHGLFGLVSNTPGRRQSRCKSAGAASGVRKGSARLSATHMPGAGCTPPRG